MDGTAEEKESMLPGVYRRANEAMRSKKYRYASLMASAFACIILLEVVVQRSPMSFLQHNILDDVYNSTLGFEKVFAIGFPDRTDKRDAITMASSFAGFQVEWSPAVDFEDIPSKAAPSTWDFEAQSKGALGCWRAHMDVMRSIVARRISSAIILEDDSDWSYNLKDQLYELGLGAQAIEDVSPPEVPHSPYGDSWDFLWLGHCRLGPPDEATRFWVIEDDPTVPPIPKRHAKWRQSHVPEDILSNQTRLVFNARSGSCAYGYAVTYEGARKILMGLSLRPINMPVDLSYRDLCGGLIQPFNCIGVYPPLISSHRFAGPASRDSDLNDKGDAYHAEYTQDVPFSTIMNIPRFIKGEKTVVSQTSFGRANGEVPALEMAIDEPYVVKGKLKHIDLHSITPEQVTFINE